MKQLLSLLLVLLLPPWLTGSSEDWGFFGHKRINELAVYTLPEEMFGFYKEHINFLIEHSVDPDKRRYGVEGEAPRHFIDIDHYCNGDPHCNPFNLVPRRWYDAVAKFSEDTLQAYGIVPWHIPMMTERLTKAFIEKDVTKILRVSAELGHYVADAHVPLHTTENYNGQMTNQVGIHGFWESRLPEIYSADYDFFMGKAKYIKSPLSSAWDFVLGSHMGLDSVLRFEAQLNESFPRDRKYSFEERGRVITQVYSEEYSHAYHQMLNGQVERRMKASVINVGSLWYTAWVDAGQPNLDDLMNPDLELIEQEIVTETSVPDKPELKKRLHDN